MRAIQSCHHIFQAQAPMGPSKTSDDGNVAEQQGCWGRSLKDVAL
jgi:hypothetical protein